MGAPAVLRSAVSESAEPGRAVLRLSARRLELQVVAAAAVLSLVPLAAGIVGLVWLAHRSFPAQALLERSIEASLVPGAVLAAAGIVLAWIVARTLARAISLRDAEPASARPRVTEDRLTGLLERTAFLSFADDAVCYFKRYSRSVAIMKVNVDNLSAINERYGADAGDQVLRHIADILDLSLRQTDKISRFGGDDFVVLLREIGEADTMALANRIRRAVEEIGARYADCFIPVTICIGAALVSSDDQDVGILIGRAGRALRAAKTAGRNSVLFDVLAVPAATLGRAA